MDKRRSGPGGYRKRVKEREREREGKAIIIMFMGRGVQAVSGCW